MLSYNFVVHNQFEVYIIFLQLFSHALPERNDNFNFHLQWLFQGTWLRFLFVIRELTRTICFTIHSTKSFKVADQKIDNLCWCFHMNKWLSVDIREFYLWGRHHFIGLPGFRFSPKPLLPYNAGFWIVHWWMLSSGALVITEKISHDRNKLN